jgi:DNA primase small subunit
MAKGKDPVTPGFPPSDEARMRFVKQMFSKYYSETKVPAPSKIEQREFGVITERAGMWRHLGFPTEAEMQAFLMKQAPLHAYHSSAYYGKPAARTMEEKGWLGADLVFDLDADHIEGSENMTMEEMLAAVKVQFTKLLDDFLLDDFGFSEKDVKIVFSGGRGYHAHISNKSVLKLDSHERREIVDYITNPDEDNLISEEALYTNRFKDSVTTKYTYKLFPKGTPSWRGKVTARVMDFIDETEGLDKEKIIGKLMYSKGIGFKLANGIYDDLYLGKPGNRGIDKMQDLNLDVFSCDLNRTSFIKFIKQTLIIGMEGETDEPVTSDIKRLIRLPESLHGKTGLVVHRLGIREYRDFLPLRDAVWKGYGDNAVKVTGREDSEINLAGQRFRLSKDRDDELPAYAAAFFACQKKCDIRN